nr:hypothetical protein GCM10020093_000290 [Planobispora longispora]BFE89110.1 hypothetical protein GCM10020093_117110 [Planobispora longispora]
MDPQDITTIVHTLGRGLDGKGPQIREIVEGGGKVIDVAHRRREEFQRFIGDTAALSGSLADKGDEIIGISADVNVLTPACWSGPTRYGRCCGSSTSCPA